MQFALGAGKLFNIDEPGEFDNTIISTLNTMILAIHLRIQARNATSD